MVTPLLLENLVRAPAFAGPRWGGGLLKAKGEGDQREEIGGSVMERDVGQCVFWAVGCVEVS